MPAELLFLIVFIIYLGCALYSSYGPVKDKTIPDLRLSEYAPDLEEAIKGDPFYGLKEKERKKAQEAAEEARYYAEQHEKRSIARMEAMQRDEEAWLLYTERYNEAKAKRWREGNPVTRENPLKDYETPPKPFISSAFY